jgi:hypothetical protein
MNISKLHQKISNIFPIDGISMNDNNEYIFHSSIPIPEDKLSEMNTIVEECKLEYERDVKREILNINWKNKLSDGWLTSFGWKLGLDTQDVTLLTGAFLLAKEAASNGIDAPVSIVDISGQSHELDLNDFTTLMLSYGQARSQLSSVYSTKLNNINSATNIEDIQLVDVTL